MHIVAELWMGVFIAGSIVDMKWACTFVWETPKLPLLVREEKSLGKKGKHGSFYLIPFKSMKSFQTKEKNAHCLWGKAVNCQCRVMWEKIQDFYWARCIETRFFPICCLATTTFVLATTWSHWAIWYRLEQEGSSVQHSAKILQMSESTLVLALFIWFQKL